MENKTEATVWGLFRGSCRSMINKPLPLIGIIVGILILRSFKGGGGLLIMDLHFVPQRPLNYKGTLFPNVQL